MAAADERSRLGAQLPLRSDLAADLAAWIAEGNTPSSRAPVLSLDDHRRGAAADVKLFNVPSGLIRILDRDLEAAGILKSDDRGRTIDLHAIMRHAFGTLLSKWGRGSADGTGSDAAQRNRTDDVGLHGPEAA